MRIHLSRNLFGQLKMMKVFKIEFLSYAVLYTRHGSTNFVNVSSIKRLNKIK